jgi:septum formation inhibitor-activating ATPase MinD
LALRPTLAGHKTSVIDFDVGLPNLDLIMGEVLHVKIELPDRE